MEEKGEKSYKEERIRSITQIYYSRPEIQKALFDFSENREISPRYFEGFGKRPDSFQYKSDVYELAKKGATSFHCSEELWSDPLAIETGMNEQQLNSMRKGWDLLIDIDCKWFDYSKKAAHSVILALKKNGVKNIGLKFSGSKGFHIFVPWKAFPKELNGIETKNLFPELPRKIVAFLRSESEKILKTLLPDDFYKQFESTTISKGRKCNTCHELAQEKILANYFCPTCGNSETKRLSSKPENLKCPNCRKDFQLKTKTFYFCDRCKISSLSNPDNFSSHDEHDLFELMGLDLILVSPRHLFRMPYSLHEKTALVSLVINEDDLEKFDPKDANPLTAKILNFTPLSEEEEAKTLVINSLEWYKENMPNDEIPYSEREKTNSEFKPIKIENLSDSLYPPSIKKILEGVSDGRKRAAFILINFFRSIGVEKEVLEKIIYGWNEKNEVPLKQGYLKAQIFWSYKNKIVPPPNFDKDYYKGIGIIPTDEEMRLKNPVNYVLKNNAPANNPQKNKKAKKTNKFKNAERLVKK